MRVWWPNMTAQQLAKVNDILMYHRTIGFPRSTILIPIQEVTELSLYKTYFPGVKVNLANVPQVTVESY